MKTITFLAAIGLSALLLFSFKGKEKHIILVDIAHGGDDHGTSKDALSEKDLTLAIGKLLSQTNDSKTIEIHLTRTDDRMLTMEEKKQLVDRIKPTLILSLHANHAQNEQLSGIEIYHSKDLNDGESDLSIAKEMQIALMAVNKNVNIKAANFAIFKLAPTIPTLLLELGFLSNPEDRSYLTSTAGQEKIAKALLEAIK